MSDDIYTAAEQNNVKRLEELLADGADVNEQDWDRGNTPIHWASACGNLDAIEVLLEYGADINIQNKHGRTPLHALVSERYDKIVLWLVQYCNADPHIPDKRGVTSYDLAQRFFQPEIDQAIANRGTALQDDDDVQAAPADDEDGPSPGIPAIEESEATDHVKVYSKSGSFKTIPINPFTAVDQAIATVIKKLNWPDKFHRHLDLNELVTKVVGNKRYKKESVLDAAELIVDVMRKWPLSPAANGVLTNDNCHLVLSVKATAPTKVHVLYSQM
jgi:ankyrin repeat protein